MYRFLRHSRVVYGLLATVLIALFWAIGCSDVASLSNTTNTPPPVTLVTVTPRPLSEQSDVFPTPPRVGFTPNAAVQLIPTTDTSELIPEDSVLIIATADQRPIATMDPLSTPFSRANAEPTPLPTPLPGTSVPTATPDPEIDLQKFEYVRATDPPADRDTLAQEFRNTRDALRNLTYTVNQAEANGALACGDIVRYFALVGQSPSYSVSAEMQIMYGYYQTAIAQTKSDVQALNSLCSELVESVGLQEATVELAEIEQPAVWQSARDGSREALGSMYTAMSWLNISPDMMREIFLSTRGDIFSYGTYVRSATADDCAIVADIYRQILEDSPVFSTPYDYRRNAYIHYISAINSVRGGGEKMADYCRAWRVGNSAATSDVILEEARQAAWVGRGIALFEVDAAITVIAPTPTPSPSPDTPRPTARSTTRPQATTVPTQPPVRVWQPTATPTPTPIAIAPRTTRAPTPIPPAPTAAIVVRPTTVPLTSATIEIVDLRKANTGFWALDLEVFVQGGVAPYTLQSGDFKANGTTITIVYGCAADFVDFITVTDATGASVNTNVLYVSRSPYCEQ